MKHISYCIPLMMGLLCYSCGPKQAPIVYETEVVSRGDIVNSVTATGTIEPVTKVDVGTQVSGIINKIYVDFNSVVKKGQLIAELDRTNLLARLQSAEAQLASTRSDYQYQQSNLKRMKELLDKEFISIDEYETARLSYEKAQSSLKMQQLSVDEAKTNLSYAYIYSPINGVILSREVEEGQTVAASMTTPTLFTIAKDLTDMRVIANIDEADIGNVKAGQRVIFSVDAFPNDEFEGKVTQVRQQPTTVSNVVTYEVVISAPNPDLKLKPGLTANVMIYTMEVKDVLYVSSKALQFKPKSNAIPPKDVIEDCDAKTKVWKKEGNILGANPIETGVSNGSLVEVKSGVQEGDNLVIGVSQATFSEDGPKASNNPFMPGPRNNKKK